MKPGTWPATATPTSPALGPLQPDSIFRIYSMTKPITSVALMTLLEQGHFELDDAAKRWIPALGELEVYQQGKIESDITVRQLLTHTAGFSYGFEPDIHEVDKLYAKIWRQRLQDQSMQQLLPQLLELPLLHQPGQAWRYSIATDICGYLIELLSDMPARGLPATDDFRTARPGRYCV